MRKRDNKAKIILIGCGPHARRVYLPALHRISNIKLELIIDLEKQFGITINHSNIKYTSLCSINSIGKLIGGIVDEKTKIDS